MSHLAMGCLINVKLIVLRLFRPLLIGAVKLNCLGENYE